MGHASACIRSESLRALDFFLLPRMTRRAQVSFTHGVAVGRPSRTTAWCPGRRRGGATRAAPDIGVAIALRAGTVTPSSSPSEIGVAPRRVCTSVQEPLTRRASSSPRARSARARRPRRLRCAHGRSCSQESSSRLSVRRRPFLSSGQGTDESSSAAGAQSQMGLSRAHREIGSLVIEAIHKTRLRVVRTTEKWLRRSCTLQPDFVETLGFHVCPRTTRRSA
jgi:hypothetical protein